MAKNIHYNRLKEVMREQGRSNRWLAKQIERTESTVSRWCSNVQQPDLETLYRIAATLDVPVCDLLTDYVPTDIDGS